MSAVEVLGSGTPFRMEEKRFFVPGVTLRSACPACHRLVEQRLCTHYFARSLVNEPSPFNFYCLDCDESWEVQVVLRVTVEAAPTSNQKTAAEAVTP